MTTPTKEIETVLAYSASLLGHVLVIETSGSAYGTIDARNGLNTNATVINRLKANTGKTLSQMGTLVQAVHPFAKTLTG